MHDYRQETDNIFVEKLRGVLNELPPYCRYFFNAKNQTFEKRSEYAYATDLKVFFEYIRQNNPIYVKLSIKEIPAEIFNQLNTHDIEDYLSYLEKYVVDGDHRSNGDSGKRRKLATLQTFCKYLKEQGIIENNPAEYVARPTLHKKDIVTLTKEEKQELLFAISSGYGMSAWQETINQYCRPRDTAILMLLLGTGIRVSELVGLNVEDVDFKNNMISIIRKGGKEGHVYFHEEVRKALLNYYSPSIVPIGTRDGLNPPPEERAFFVSRKRTRLTVRAVQKIIEKYKILAFGEDYKKKVTPHMMRRTYGTELYLEKGDIKLVSDTLGHESIATTQQYYAATSEEKKKSAAINVL